MRGHDQTSGRAPCSAWFWLILFASAVPASVRAESAPDPIDLAARQIQVWGTTAEQWLLLSGQVAIRLGTEGLNAREAVVRITLAQERGAWTYRVDLYAEGDVQTIGRANPPRSAYRTTFTSRSGYRLSQGDRSRVSRLNGPPNEPGNLDRAHSLKASVAAPSARVAGVTPSPVQPRQAPAPVQAKSVVASTYTRPTGLGPNSPSRSLDPSIARVQVPAVGPVAEEPVAPPADPPVPAAPGPIELPPIEPGPAAPAPVVPKLEAPAIEPQVESPPVPLPGPDNKPAPPLRSDKPKKPPEPPMTPILPGSQRITRIHARNGGPDFQVRSLPTTKEGVKTWIIRGGVNVVSESPAPRGLIDLEADSVIIWRYSEPLVGPDGENIDDPKSPMDIYLEGNVVVRQDARTQAGQTDQKTFKAKQGYYDFRTDRFIGLDAQIDLFAPGLITPTKVTAPRIEQYRPLVNGPDGKSFFGPQQIRADTTVMTGSRFPNPGYRITNRSVDMNKKIVPATEPNSGKKVATKPGEPEATEEIWEYDARQNVFFMGPVPTFYWPRITGEADDFQPVLRSFAFGSNNYFGQMVFTDWNGFRAIGVKKPKNVDLWNIDVDYLSSRTKDFPALGTEIGWFGKDLINDFMYPYGAPRSAKVETSDYVRDYFGFFDAWGLHDLGNDVLGTGPAIITNNIAAGEQPATSGGGGGPLGVGPVLHAVSAEPLQLPAHAVFLAPVVTRTTSSEELRVQSRKVGSYSDRYFLEEYYKRLFETGLDQETLAYGIRQKDNWAWTLWTEANLRSWDTDTQWLPKLDYYRIGDSLLGDTFTYYNHTGVDYANVHTASEVNNPYIFAFMPYDPISNTSGTFQSGRAYSSHEIDLPLKFDFFRIMPYAQGQLVGWNNQVNGEAVGRYWGAAGIRADIMAWKKYPNVKSELFNVHGLNHKISMGIDYRDSYSNVNLNKLGIQDDLDDNTNESVRRYFALTNYVGGVLPNQYDPRHLILRRMMSPITGTTDVQGSLNALQFNMHQRLQTKPRAGRPAAGHRLHDARPDIHLFSPGHARQLRQAVWSKHV